MDVQNKDGLQGLGNINTNNASATVSTPYGYLDKTDTDGRKIPTDFSKFSSSLELANSFIKWLNNACGLQSSLSKDEESDRIVGSQAIYLDMNGQIFKIYCIQNPDMAVSFAGGQAILGSIQAKLVLFGNYSAPKFSSIEKQLRQNSIEAFSIEDIYDINEAVDHASKGLPHMTMGTDLSNQLAKIVCTKYKGKFEVHNLDGAEPKTFSDLGQSFKSGFEQLKDSVSGIFTGLTGTPGQSEIFKDMSGVTNQYHHDVPPQFNVNAEDNGNNNE